MTPIFEYDSSVVVYLKFCLLSMIQKGKNDNGALSKYNPNDFKFLHVFDIGELKKNEIVTILKFFEEFETLKFSLLLFLTISKFQFRVIKF